MSEYINNSKARIELLKKLILKLHNGESVEQTQKELKELMGSVPYGEVVQAEQQLIEEGLDQSEVLKFCDLHSEALKGTLDSGGESIPPGHPVDVFISENAELKKVIGQIRELFKSSALREPQTSSADILASLNSFFNSLMDIDKHYQRKENLVFPYLEKNNITGPPMVMWGKDDEVRGLLKSSHLLFAEKSEVSAEVVNGFIELMFEPTLKAIEEMIYKEEKILFPMCLDTLTEIDWHNIQKQSDDYGYCLYYPDKIWTPQFSTTSEEENVSDSKIRLSTGALKREQLEAMINSLPIDLTFVDAEDKVRYFSQGKDRVFQRSKAILGREVQYCHPPSSVHVVNQIIDDFKSGRQNEAKFWIQFHGKYVHIAYYAVRNEHGDYLGTVELTQDIAEYKNIEGERRILQYDGRQ